MKKRILALSLCLLLMVSFGVSVANAASIGSSDFNRSTNVFEVKGLVDKLERAITVDFRQNTIIMDKAKIVSICGEVNLDALNAFYKENGMESITTLELAQRFINGIDSVNQALERGEYKILAGGTIVEVENDEYYLQGGSTYSQTKWWGVRHYKSTAAASKWAYELNQFGQVGVGVAVVAGTIFGGLAAVPTSLTSTYAFMLANSVSYYNGLSNRGIVADITWLLIYDVDTQ